MAEITAYSKPDYDIPFYPDSAWSCQDWMTWHKKMVEEFGQSEANKRFVNAWDERYYFSTGYSFCKYNSEFNEYFTSVGLDPDNFVSEIFSNTRDSAVNLSQGVKSISGLVNNRIGASALVALIGFLFYWIYLK